VRGTLESFLTAWNYLQVAMRRLDSRKAAAIDLVEAAYSLPSKGSDWLESVLPAALAAVESAVFASGITFDRSPHSGRVLTQSWRHAAASDEVREVVEQWAPEVPVEVERAYFKVGLVNTGSGISAGSRRWFESFAAETGIAADALLVNANEPDKRGALIAMFLPEQTKLDSDERHRWEMLGAHLTAGHRVWRAVASKAEESTTLPCGAEAMVDPRTFRLTDAEGCARGRGIAATLRASARQVDRARGRLRRNDPDEALQTWWALMHGRWSMVDWFDSDGRRFVLGIPNGPDLGDPRGLTERELQVAMYAALGESGKLISYRLGVSKGTVSNALDGAMRKLDVKTQPQLVEKMRGFTKHFGQQSVRPHQTLCGLSAAPPCTGE